MKTFAAVFLAVLTIVSANANPQFSRGHGQHSAAFTPHLGGTHFVGRSGNGFRPHFHYGNGGVIIFDPFVYGGYYDLLDNDPIYQGQAVSQDAESLPYGTPTSDPNLVISPYEPHATISVDGIPHGAKVQDPVSNLVFLNP